MLMKPDPLSSPQAQETIRLIEAAATVVLVTHDGPDGDGIGSQIGLARALRRAGRKVWIVNAGSYPRSIRFLDSGNDVIVFNESHHQRNPHLFQEADLVILVDTGEFERIGCLGERVQARQGPVVCIDHHQPGERAIPGIVAPDFTSCGELIVHVIDALGIEITKDVATALYGAILSDTQQFRFTKQDPDVFAVAARLVAAGAEPETIAGRMFGTMTRDRLTLMTRIFNSARFECGGRLVHSVMTQEMISDLSVDREEIRNMVNLIGDLEGVEISALFKVFKPGVVKVSMRCKQGLVISDVAEILGGGGHKQAAGADIEGDLAQIQASVVKMLINKLN